jgi:uncharacterized protein YggU (UPF0235/DUF167 family)
MLAVRVVAAPADGAANEAVARLLADALGLRKSAVRIAAGASARVKQVKIEGVTAADLARAFGPAPR